MRFRIYFLFMRLPVLPLLYARIRLPLRAGALRRSTELVIDGFPRSANSYALVAIQQSNPDVRICSHLHSPRAIKVAARRQLPILLLIRDPDEACASLVQLMPGLRLQSAYRIYWRYYESIVRHRPACQVASFSEVVGSLRDVVSALNARFGIALNVSTRSDDSDIFAAVDQRAALFPHGDDVSNVVARPSDARKSFNEIDEGDTPDRRRAKAIYRLMAPGQ